MSSNNEFLPAGVDLGAIAEAAQRAVPGSILVSVDRLGDDLEGEPDDDRVDYGEPVLVRLETHEGPVELVFLTKRGPESRRAARAERLLLSFDAAAALPGHARALDVGVVSADGDQLASLEGTKEFYVLSEFVAGHAYADELRALAERGELLKADLERANELAAALADLHVREGTGEQYRASVRDAFGGEEGILGVIDAFSANDTPGAPRLILEHLERLALPWRWKLRDYEHRASRVHGDFNPFNAVFSAQGLRFLEGRGGPGEPAADVLGVAMHYVFFGLLWPGTWRPCFRRLWNTFWNTYLSETGDAELLEVLAPFFLLQALSLCSPLTYPGTPPGVRERLLTAAEQVLLSARFDPSILDSVFREEGPPSTR